MKFVIFECADVSLLKKIINRASSFYCVKI
mgnify:FL=1